VKSKTSTCFMFNFLLSVRQSLQSCCIHKRPVRTWDHKEQACYRAQK